MEQRVHHLLIEKEDSLFASLSKQLGLTFEEAEWLVQFGGAYLNRKRVLEEQNLIPGDYLRVHLKPKRFSVGHIVWEDRIVQETEDLLIVDKPAGIPVHATLDNLKENLLHQLEGSLQENLYLTHRLDVATRGLIVFARSVEAQKKFNHWLKTGQVKKYYMASVGHPIALGPMISWMKPSDRAPKEMSATPRGNWQRCEMNILDCQKKSSLYQLSIELITGRTHQIRAQLAQHGSPIIGDTLYGGIAKEGSVDPLEDISLDCSRLIISPLNLSVSLH